MDRILQTSHPIALSVTPQALKSLRELTSADPQEYLRQQLAADLCSYAVGERAYLVSRNIFAVVTFRSGQAGGTLSVESVSRSSSHEYNRAAHEGHRVKASWTIGGAGRGAQEFWQSLKGGTGGFAGGSGGVSSAGPGGSSGAILPQDQIDLLIASLKRDNAGPEQTYTAMADRTVRHPVVEEHQALLEHHNIPASQVQPPLPEPPSFVQAQPPIPDPVENTAFIADAIPPAVPLPAPAARAETETAAALEAPSLTGVTQDYWLELGPNQNSVVPEPLPTALPAMETQPTDSVSLTTPSRTEPVVPVAGIVAGMAERFPYTVIVTDREDLYAETLSLLAGQAATRTILGFWAGMAREIRLGPQLGARLAALRQQYRAAAADLETALTRLRQHEQILPNIEKYRTQQTELAVELEKVQAELQRLQMDQVLSTHEGRELAKRAYAMEARRRRTEQALSHATYGMLRRAKPGPLHCQAMERARTAFTRSQQELEGCLDKLALLERESQRRLEYQSDWQAAIKRQIQIQHELEEIERFLKGVALSTPAGLGDPGEIERWLRNEREKLRSREQFQMAWLAYLTEERSWALRCQDEPVVIIGDASLLAEPRMACGAHLIILSAQGGLLGNLPDDCASWVMMDSSGKIIGSGKGIGAILDHLPVLLAGLAAENHLPVEEAQRCLGLADNAPHDHVILG